MLRQTTILCLLVVALLCACGGPAAPAVVATATSAAQPVQLQPTAAASTSAPPPSNTPQPTNTDVPPTATPVPTATPMPTATPVPPTNTVAPTNTPAPTATPAPSVTVKSATLNVRNGPGSNYGIVTAVKQGDTLGIVGQVDNCAWFKVATTGGGSGWVAGGADYVSANVACAAVPAAQAPPTLVPPPTPAPLPPTAAKPAAPAPTPSESLPADKTCILFENYLGAELTITLSGPSAQTFKIPAMDKYVTCLDPGPYNYTLDAPPPWDATNGSFDAQAGRHFRFPIEGRP